MEKVRIEININVPVLVWLCDLIHLLYENKLLTDNETIRFQKRIFGIIRSSTHCNIQSKYLFHRVKQILREDKPGLILQYHMKNSIKDLQEKYAGDNIL